MVNGVSAASLSTFDQMATGSFRIDAREIRAVGRAPTQRPYVLRAPAPPAAARDPGPEEGDPMDPDPVAAALAAQVEATRDERQRERAAAIARLNRLAAAG